MGGFRFSGLEERNWEVAVRSIVGRLNTILTQRFGCRVVYRSLAQMSFEAPELVSRLNNLFEQSQTNRVPMNEEVILATRQNGQITGYVIIINGGRIDPDKLEEAVSLIDYALIDSITKAERLNLLVRLERNTWAHDESENVIPFRGFRNSAYVIPMENPKIRRQRAVQRQPVLIRGNDPLSILKAAVEFQECLQSPALVPFSALDHNVLSEPELWYNLGAITVLVESVDKLTREEIEGLLVITKMYSQSNCPQLLGGQLDRFPPSNQVLINQLFKSTFRCPDATTTRLSELVDVFVCSEPRSPSGALPSLN